MDVSTPSLATDGEASLWQTIRESLAGSNQDYTDGDIGRAVVLLAIPSVLELALESVFAVVDVFFVSRLGPDAVAIIGLSEGMLTITYAVASGLSIGAMATVARRVGEGDHDGASRAAVQAILIGILFSVPAGIAGAWFARPLLVLMGATGDVLAHSAYTVIVLGLDGVVLMLFLINAVFRGAGDAAIAMRVLWIANAINIFLDPCLIYGLGPFPRLGVTGAAVATVTGRGIGVLVQLYLLVHSPRGRGGRKRDADVMDTGATEGRRRIVIRWKHLRIEPRVMMNMLKLSGSAVLQELITTTSWVGLVRILASFGSAALAGYTIAIRIVVFALLPSFGLANAAATLVGQNLGAQKPDRAEASVWRACLYNLFFLGAIGVVFIVFAVPLVAGFTSDEAVAPVAVSGLRIISSGFVMYAYGFVLTMAFNGAGDTWTPTLINVFCFWLVEIPLAYGLARGLEMGPAGVFWSIAIAFSMMALISAAVFRRGRWKLKHV
jgi:putative MATE family efflux protein